MSHITTVKTQIKDLDSLEVAAAQCGLQLIRGTQPGALRYKWYGAPKPCDHVLRVMGGSERTYEVGVVAQGDGTYSLAYDPFANGYGLMDAIGPNASKLHQNYAMARVYATMGHDHHIERFTDEQGRIQMRLVART